MLNAIIRRLSALEQMKSKRRIVYAEINNLGQVVTFSETPGGGTEILKKYRIRVVTWDGIPGSGRADHNHNYDEEINGYEKGLARIQEIGAKYARSNFPLWDFTCRK